MSAGLLGYCVGLPVNEEFNVPHSVWVRESCKWTAVCEFVCDYVLNIPDMAGGGEGGRWREENGPFTGLVGFNQHFYHSLAVVEQQQLQPQSWAIPHIGWSLHYLSNLSNLGLCGCCCWEKRE